YHVERILKRRGRIGHYQYLVKWRGYPEDQNTWESGSRLSEDCADLVDAYERS
uniref:Chromo domain-containing protein n=1 Tax=Phytophthora ramorum TaxID=164328 RepID=H3G5Q0_PHYRM